MPGPSVFPSGEPGVSGDFWALKYCTRSISSVLGVGGNSTFSLDSAGQPALQLLFFLLSYLVPPKVAPRILSVWSVRTVKAGMSYIYYIGEGNGTPLQYSYLENPWTEEPGRLQSMGSLRVGHD